MDRLDHLSLAYLLYILTTFDEVLQDAQPLPRYMGYLI